MSELRNALEQLAQPETPQSRLFLGLKAYPDNWRTSVAAREVLPHYPMVLHRGSYPTEADFI